MRRTSTAASWSWPAIRGARSRSARPRGPGVSVAESAISTRPAGQTYTVVSGDSLSRIAKKHYGDADKWRRIFEANRDLINDPDEIYPGQTLKIPSE